MTEPNGSNSGFRWRRDDGRSDAAEVARALRQEQAYRTAKLLDDARQAAQRAEGFEKALGSFRDATAASGFNVSVLLEYARFLIKNSRGSTAEEVLALSLASNGAQVDAVELYLELVRELELAPSRAGWALNRLAEDVPDAPEAQRAALDYAIPHRQTGALQAIGASGDPVNRAIVQINEAYKNNTFSQETLDEAGAGMGANDLVRAHLTVALARGNRTVAGALLKDADPKAVPVNALRRAIRRARGAGKQKQLIEYLEAYRRILPEDGWAKKLQNETQRNAVSNYQMGKTGFPFPKMRPAPVYEAEQHKVFYLLHNSLPYNSAGYATRTHGLLRELNSAGWDVDGVTRLGYPYDMPGKDDLTDVPFRDHIDGVDYLRLLTGDQVEKKNPLYDYVQRYSAELTAAAKRERPAIVHAASNHWNGLTAVNVARRLGLPSIYEVRGLWEVTRGSRNPEWAASNMFKYIARMEADAAKGATKVFTITKALREEMIARGVDEQKITVLPNGVDTSRFTPIPRDEQLARELGVLGKTVIGYIGSILDYEGLELLIDAAAELAAVRDDFHVLFVGDGAELGKFSERVREEGLEEVITFTGRVPHEEVERYYSLVDITPFPRLPLPVCEMVSPLKPFEAMAMGKAIVASDVAALAEIITPGENGFLHAKGDAKSLQVELHRLLDDPDLTRRIGEQARDWVVRNRDWKSIATIVADAYAGLTAVPAQP